MRSAFDRWCLSSIIWLGILKVLTFLRRLGVTSGEDPWRHMTCGHFRTEHSKGTLAAFGLRADGSCATEARKEDVWHALAVSLQRILSANELAHRTFVRNWFGIKPRESATVDVVMADYGMDGSLRDFQTVWDPIEPVSQSVLNNERALRAEVIRTYNRTLPLSDKRRPWVLEGKLRKWADRWPNGNSIDTMRLLERMIGAVYLVLEELPADPDHPDRPDPEARLSVPDLYRYRHPGKGTLTVLARLHPGFTMVDLWFHGDHRVWEGVPLQEMIEEVRRQCGTEDLILPSGCEKGSFGSHLQCSHSRKGVINVAHDFVDFGPLRQTRSRLNDRYGQLVSGGISIPGVLFWLLETQDAFSSRKMLLPVDVPPAGKEPRTLGLVLIRTARYRDQSNPLEAFLLFQQEIHRQTKEARDRTSVYAAVFDAFTIVPISLFWMPLVFLPGGTEAGFGTVGVTFVRDAQVFLPLMSDVNIEGYVSIGSFDLRTEDGSFVASVSAKGYGDRAAQCLEAVKRAVSTAPILLSDFA